MIRNEYKNTYIITASGVEVHDQDLARCCGRYKLKDAARVVSADAQGWQGIIYDATGILVGLPPHAKTLADIKPIP